MQRFEFLRQTLLGELAMSRKKERKKERSLCNLQEKGRKRKYVGQCAGVCRILFPIFILKVSENNKLWSRPRSEPVMIK